MMKFTYSATVKGQEIETGSVKSLADKINAIYEYPIVTQHSLNNYFTRPHLMKLKVKNLESLGIKRSIKTLV